MMTDDERRSPVPAWCVLPASLSGPMYGCAGSDEFEGADLAREAWGEEAEHADSGLTAFACLWRRFGPPRYGSDNYKQLCRYVIGTPHHDIYLTLGLSGSPLVHAVGYLAPAAFRAALLAPAREWCGRLDRWAREHGHDDGMLLSLDARLADDYHRAREELGPPPARPDLSRWRELEGPVGDLSRAVFAALRELLRPVSIRDVPINILGTTGEPWDHEARPSRYAGLGVPVGAMDALLEESPADG
jgi:hypothetical protein